MEHSFDGALYFASIGYESVIQGELVRTHVAAAAKNEELKILIPPNEGGMACPVWLHPWPARHLRA